LLPYGFILSLDDELEHLRKTAHSELGLMHELEDAPTTRLLERDYPDAALNTLAEAAFTTLVLIDLMDRPEAKWAALRSRARDLSRRFNDILKRAFDEVEYRLDQERKQFRLYYPRDGAAVAPTAIGNVMRAVDSFADRLYGLDATLVLPRLQAVMGADALERLRNAQERMELLQWGCIGALVVRFVGTPIMAKVGEQPLPALLIWVSALLVAWLLYRAALQAALGYAEALRLSFDYERGKVLEWLGISVPEPVNKTQEVKIWSNVQQWWEYGKAPNNYTLNTEDNTKKEG
jgi:hypothetical protein